MRLPIALRMPVVTLSGVALSTPSLKVDAGRALAQAAAAQVDDGRLGAAIPKLADMPPM